MTKNYSTGRKIISWAIICFPIMALLSIKSGFAGWLLYQPGRLLELLLAL